MLSIQNIYTSENEQIYNIIIGRLLKHCFNINHFWGNLIYAHKNFVIIESYIADYIPLSQNMYHVQETNNTNIYNYAIYHIVLV